MHEIFTRTLVEPRRAAMRAIFERAVARGEVRADVDLEVAVDLTAGPMIYRLLLGGMDLPALGAHAAEIMRTALTGLQPR